MFLRKNLFLSAYILFPVGERSHPVDSEGSRSVAATLLLYLREYLHSFCLIGLILDPWVIPATLDSCC